MISRLTGVWEDDLIEVNGIGYAIQVPRPPQAGEETTLHVHPHDNGGATSLYGFTTRSEREAFRALIAVPGVGPSAAFKILEAHQPAHVASLINSKDVKSLAGIRGVGKKTAERVIQMCDTTRLPQADSGATNHREALEALEKLGVNPDKARRLVEAAAAAGSTKTEDLVMESLRLGSAERGSQPQ